MKFETLSANTITTLTKQLAMGIAELKLALPTGGMEQILAYIQLLLKWNDVHNLTAITDPKRVLTEHILDSLSIAPYLRGDRIIDVGTGAGLPGIPLAILYPERHFALLDSVGKKIHFLNQVVAELKLTNVEPIQARVETYKPEQCFNTVVTRALGAIRVMLTQTEHLCCPGGRLLFMKGIFPQGELSEIDIPHEVHPLKVPGLIKQRHVVCIKTPVK